MRTRVLAFVVALCSAFGVGGQVAQAHSWKPYKRDFLEAHWAQERYECRQHSHGCTRWEMKRHLRIQARKEFRARSRWLRANKPAYFYSHHGTVGGAIERAFPDHVQTKAKSVARCESEFDIYARSSSGKYLGLFQMGPDERDRFGFAWNKWTQARGAYRYWKISGWSPWPVCGD